MRNRFQRWWARYRSIRRQLPVPVLVLTDLVPVALVLVAVLGAGAFWLHSWSLSYNLLVSNTAPDDEAVKVPVVGWLISVLGWLVLPAVIGAVVGELVGGLVERHEGDTLDELARGLREELGLPHSNGPSHEHFRRPGQPPAPGAPSPPAEGEQS